MKENQAQNQDRSSWPFGGDHVIQATNKLPERDRDAVRWLFFHSIENGITMKGAAEAIRYSSTTVYRLCKGEYDGDVGKVAEAIAGYRRIAEERSTLVSESFVETATAKRIFQICDAASLYQIIAAIYGDSQTGKTTALEEYTRRHNHGATKLIRLPAAAGVQMMIRTFAEACQISPRSSFEALRKRVLKAIDANTLVIIDELHQAFSTYHSNSRIACLEIIREIHDRTGCGMVLCGTNIARDEIQDGPHKRLLEQINRRGVFKLQLPQYATIDDRNAIAKHYGLPVAKGDAKHLVDRIIKSNGLKAYVTYLKAAARLANRRKLDVNWDHFIAAHDTIFALSRS
jgi:DNA transposition AAA+ family ATPase